MSYRVLEKEERGYRTQERRAAARDPGGAGSHFRRRGSARDASWHGPTRHKLVN
jgi:hypothetical protein